MGLTRWEAIRRSILQLPEVNSFPNIINSLKMIDDYLSDQPEELKLKDGVRYLATDFLVPAKTRLKVYMRYPVNSFDGIWDFYTLGGRIKGLEEDKEKFRDLMEMMSDGTGNDIATDQVQMVNGTSASLAKPREKTTTIYFSLSAENPGPAPKIGFFPGNTAKNDQIIAKGIDEWWDKYGWYDGGKTLEKRLGDVL